MYNELHKKLENIRLKNNICGMSIAVTNSKEILFSAGFGLDSIERPNVPTTADSVYRIASVTKIITGLTIMKLCEDGILDLNTAVGDYVPWLKLKDDVQKCMTLFHLLSHTSGLPSEYTPDGPKEESALEESLKKELSHAKLVSYPHEGKYLYSNLGIRLASYIAEQKTDIHYTELSQKYILSKLGMNNSTYDLRVAATYPLSLPHSEENGALKLSHYIKENAARMAAGGLYSTVTDLTKLARCILNNGTNDNGETVIQSSTLKKMVTPVVSRGDNKYYGLTFMTDHYKDGVLTGHLGNADPYGAGFFVDIQKGIGAIVLMNTFRSELRTEILKMILEML